MPKTKLPDRGKPTPGPWEEARTIIGTGEFNGRIGVQIMNREGWEVARVFDPEYDGISPNIRMMINAPNLLFCLEQIAYEVERGDVSPRTLQDAFHAINKVKGGE